MTSTFTSPRLLARWILALLAGAVLRGTGAEIHVSPTGNDANPGSAAQPLASFAAAQALARTFAGNEAVTVDFHAGTYYLPSTIHFTAADSGTAARPVTYRAAPGEAAVISGGERLGGLNWTTHSGAVLKATVPAGMVIDQLFANNVRQHQARYPNYDAGTAIFNGYAADCISTARAANWANPAGGYFHALHGSRWGGMEYRITGKNASNTVSYTGGWQNNRASSPHTTYRFVENIFEELDAPGEWFHNPSNNTLYFRPPAGLNLATATLETAGRLKHLIEFDGSQAAPVKFVNLQGLVFRHAARTFMETNEPLLRSDWCIYRGGAILLEGTEDCALADCEFDQLGGNAVFFSNYNRRSSVRGSHFHDIGASAVCFTGDPAAVRNPLFEYGQTQGYAAIDKTNTGPKTDNYPADCTVEDCLIRGIGRVEKQPAGVQISMASRITVRHCSIYDCARAGINIGDGCWGGHLIEFCDVFDTVLETNDHGSFNAWGRDRYWNLGGTPDNAERKRIALLDNYQTTVIRNSRWRCDHGWDIDLDDGSSNYSITNNLLLNNGLKWREGFKRIGRNNIILGSSLHPHVWYEDSGDIFERNIVQDAYQPASMSSSLTKWGESLDYNLFPTEANRTAYAAKGCDAHSVAGDPQFTDPGAGNFQVKAGSPALALGFANFPMDQFGVQKPALKAIARVPEGIGSALEPPMATAFFRWLGARVKAVTTPEEASAFGTDPAAGGVFFAAGFPESAASGTGLQESDLIASINGAAVKTVPEMVAALAAAAGDVNFGIVRGQAATTLVVAAADLAEAGTLALESGSFRVPDAGLAVDRFILLDGTAAGSGILAAGTAELRGGILMAGLATPGQLVKAGSSAAILATPVTAGATAVNEGSLKLDPTLVPPVRGGLLLRLDASAAATMTLQGNAVSQWADADGKGSYAEQSIGSQQPQRVATALNGRAILDFGSYQGNTGGRFMQFKDAKGAALNLANIRSAFWVMKGSNHLLTHSSSYHFHRGGEADTAVATIWNSSFASANVRNGQTWLNGVVVNGTTTALANSYNLVSLVTTGNVEANRLCGDRTFRSGGQQIGEILLYDRALNEAERVQVEGYLQHKWFGAAAGAGPLPVAALGVAAGATLDLGGCAQTLAGVSGAGTLSNSVATAATLTVDLAGSAEFRGGFNGPIQLVKKGAGTQQLGGPSAHAGSTTVNSGTLQLARAMLDDASAVNIIAPGVLLMAEGTDAVSAFNFDGTAQLKGLWGAPGNGGAGFTSPRLAGGGLLLVSAAPLIVTSQDAWPPAPEVSNTDLGQTAFGSVSATGSGEVLTEAAQLFNGQAGNNDADSADPGEVTIGAGSAVTLNFNLAGHPRGYDISGVTSTFAWQTAGGGRSNQSYGIELTYVDGSTAVLFPPRVLHPNSTAAYTTVVKIGSSNGGILANGGVNASGVRAIRFYGFGAAAAGGVVVAREIDIFGIPTPANGSYNEWIGSFPALVNAADREKDADPDRDGLSNMLEYALDGNPAGAAAAKVLGKLADFSGSSYFTLTLPVRHGADFSGTGPLAASIAGVNYAVQGGAEPGAFNAGIQEVQPAMVESLPVLGAGWDYRSFRLGEPVDGMPGGFMRVVVSER